MMTKLYSTAVAAFIGLGLSLGAVGAKANFITNGNSAG
jgi:hypothetical protein